MLDVYKLFLLIHDIQSHYTKKAKSSDSPSLAPTRLLYSLGLAVVRGYITTTHGKALARAGLFYAMCPSTLPPPPRIVTPGGVLRVPPSIELYR